MICSSGALCHTDLEVEPPRKEASLAQNTEDGVEALGVVRHDLQQLAATRLLAVS